MAILTKRVTAFRGGATEVGSAVVDSQALRILDLAHHLHGYEGYAIQALNKCDEAPALDIANKMAEIGAELVTERDLASQCARSE